MDHRRITHLMRDETCSANQNLVWIPWVAILWVAIVAHLSRISSGASATRMRLDQHYSPQFYVELWGVSGDTIVRWFQDLSGVLKLSEPGERGKRRVELRIPYRLVHQVYEERTR